MTPEQQQIAIAKACRTTFTELVIVFPNGEVRGRGNTPAFIAEEFRRYQVKGVECSLLEVLATKHDYLSDLNAMHEAVESLRTKDGSEWFDFQRHLMDLCGSTMNCIQAKADYRAEAFLRTLGLWEE